MPTRSYRLHDGRKGSALAVRLTPRASRNEIVEVLSDGTVRIRITAPPVDGEANAKLLAFLSDVLGVPKTRLEIVAGQTGRDKLISVLDMDAAAVHRKIVARLGR